MSHFDLAKYYKNLYLAEVEELPKNKWTELSKYDPNSFLRYYNIISSIITEK